jgi:hypothetical protein
MVSLPSKMNKELQVRIAFSCGQWQVMHIVKAYHRSPSLFHCVANFLFIDNVLTVRCCDY